MRRRISAFVEDLQAFTTEDQETAVNALLQAIGGNFAHMTTSFALVSSSAKVNVKSVLGDESRGPFPREQVQGK